VRNLQIWLSQRSSSHDLKRGKPRAIPRIKIVQLARSVVDR
jgi:hypothetical protein